jgi:hypothetical protein
MPEVVESRRPSAIGALRPRRAQPGPRLRHYLTGLSLLGALLIPIVSAVRCYHYPAFAQAFFEYAGREIVAGKLLYRDIWDNKLPSIFYIDALWQLLLGANYVAHTIAELTVELTTIAAFAVFTRREGIRSWPAATLGFALLASIPSLRAFGHTEPYALLFIMLALVAIQRPAAITAGVLLAIATTFWIPAGLMLLPILLARRNEGSRGRFAFAFSAALSVYAAWSVVIFGGSAIGALLSDMRSYEALRLNPHGSLPMTLRDQAWNTIERTFLTVPLVILAALLRRPASEPERFALLWLGSALAGAALNLNFFDHYFLPSCAALAFATAAFGEGQRPAPLRRVAIVLVIAILALHAPRMFQKMRLSTNQASTRMRDSAVVGQILAASLPPDATIAVYAFEPGIYLHTGRSARGRFANALGLDLTTSAQRSAREGQYLEDVAASGAFVMYPDQALSPRLAGLLRQRFVAVCPTRLSAYRLFIDRSLVAHVHCAR